MNQYIVRLEHMLGNAKFTQNGINFGSCTTFWPNGLSAPMTPPVHQSELPPLELFKGIIQATCLDSDTVKELLSSVPGDWKEYDVDVCELSLRGRSDLLADG